MKTEIEEWIALEKLNNEFKKIRKMGYVKSSRNGFTGIGKTFEDLIWKKEDALENPDYLGIEIKTKVGYSKGYITLFNAAPKGPSNFEARRISQLYGYPDRYATEYKVLAVSVLGNLPTLVANRFLFKLQIDYEKQKIGLLITDKNGIFLEKESYWDFKIVKEKLERKLKYLALIKAWPNRIKETQYYKYYAIYFFKLKGFKEFLSLIEQGKIRINFKISVYREGERKGDTHDHGTSFEIQEENLQKLFWNIKL